MCIKKPGGVLNCFMNEKCVHEHTGTYGTDHAQHRIRCVRFVPYLSTVSIYTHTHDRKF